MIQTSEGRVLTINGKAIERKVNSLPFTVSGAVFPDNSFRTDVLSRVEFQSNGANSVTVSWGDGYTSTHQFVSSNGLFRVQWRFDNVTGGYKVGNYTYQDGYVGQRVIVFTFQYPEKLTAIDWYWSYMEGYFPNEALAFSSLIAIELQATQRLLGMGSELNGNMEVIKTQAAFLTKGNKIPDSYFDNPLKELNIYGAYNLSDHISSNLFKINQLKDTLERLFISGSNLDALPIEIAELYNLIYLNCVNNEFTDLPIEIGQLASLETIIIGTTENLTNTELISFDNLTKLESLRLSGNYYQLDISDLAQKWSGLVSLTNIGAFDDFVDTDSRFDEFINQFYTLCTTNGTITGNAPAPYPDRFRNISWGDSSLSFTGAKVAPTGYVQGSANGTPANEGEKVYVLQNQYGHTITHA